MRKDARQSHTTRRRARATKIVVALCAAAMVAGGTGFVLSLIDTPTLDMAGNAVRAEADATPGQDILARMHVREETGMSFVVPSVDLDVPLGELSAVDGEVAPPGFTSAYVIRNRGVALSEAINGTVYVVTHSLRGGGLAPGNSLIDVKRNTSRLHPGDDIHVGALRYIVTGGEVVEKTELASRDDVWAGDPARLVIITCLQNADETPSTRNLIITATLVDDDAD